MPTKYIPFGKPYTNVDQIEVSDRSPMLIDGWMDEAGAIHRRPGLLEWVDLGTASGVDGLHWDTYFNKCFAVSNGQVFAITDNAGTNADITGDALETSTPVSFVNNGTYLFMSNSGKMVTYANAGTTAYVADADAPTEVDFVRYLDTYILCNERDTNKFWWCDVNAPLTWSATNYASAEGSPDYINFIDVGWREILIGGERSIELWYNDGSSPFIRFESGFIERGILAPHSVQQINNTWYFLDHERKVCMLEGRTPKMVSTPFDYSIQSLTTMASVRGYHVNMEHMNFYVLNFPDDNMTYVYDYQHDTWFRWGTYNSETASYDDFTCNSYCYCPDWGYHLMGGKEDGKIYKVSRGYYDDNGTSMRTVYRTGWINHETDSRKRCNKLRIKLKRGVGVSGSDDEPEIMVRWRDDGSSTWSNEYTRGIGTSGNTEFFIDLKRLGMYRSRQWEFSITDATELILISAEETFDYMVN